MRRIALVSGIVMLVTACSKSDNPVTPGCIVSAISISGAPATLAVGSNVALTATVTQDGCTDLTVAWSTSNAAVVAVTQGGVVTGQAVGGPVTITATAGGKHATAQITVTNVPVNSITVTPDSIVVAPGATFTLTPTTRAADNSVLTGRAIAWSSFAGAVASVSGGVVTGLTADANTTVSATSESKSANAKVFVVSPRALYAWSDNRTPPVGSSVVPTTDYSFSTNAATIFHLYSPTAGSTGFYHLDYTDFSRAAGGTDVAFASVYSDTPDQFCAIDAWTTGTTELNCYGLTGTPSNVRFSVLLMGSATFGGRSGYGYYDAVLMGGPVAMSPFHRYSSSNLPVTMQNVSAGVYNVLFQGLGRVSAADREAVMVSAVNLNGIECHSGGWNTIGADLQVTVYCYTGAGAPIYSRFTVGVVSQPRPGARLAFLDADQPTTASYTPANSAVYPGGAVTVTRTAIGKYSIHFDGMTRTGQVRENLQASAVGTGANRCSTTYWAYVAGSLDANVICGNSAGTYVDSRFVLVAVQ